MEKKSLAGLQDRACPADFKENDRSSMKGDQDKTGGIMGKDVIIALDFPNAEETYRFLD